MEEGDSNSRIEMLEPEKASDQQRALDEAQRELLRLNQLLLQRDSHLNHIEKSLTWRLSSPFRLIPLLRAHLKSLVVLSVFALITVPLWPFFILMLFFKSGRHFIWERLQNYPDILDFLMFLKAHIPGNTESVEPSLVDGYVREMEEQGANSEDRQWRLLRLLSPYSRYQIAEIDRSSDQGAPPNEDSPTLNSISTTEASLLKIQAQSTPDSG